MFNQDEILSDLEPFKFTTNELRPGTCVHFCIIEGQHKRSAKTEKTYLQFKFRVTDSFGVTGIITANFWGDNDFKLKYLMEAVDRAYWYKDGTVIPRDFVNLTGYCDIDYDEKNPKYMKITKFIPSSEAKEKIETLKPEVSKPQAIDDDIPF